MTSPTFPAVHLPMFDPVALPLLMRVALTHPRGDPIGDVEGAVAAALGGASRLNALAKGARVALAVGSRGIAHIDRIVARAVAVLEQRGLVVFIVPAMGSHGGGTPAGQTALLAELGITPEAMRAPIEATMEVVEYGHTADGTPCLFDRNAAAADGIVVINRVKPHTTFERPIESGLVKMVAIGLGNAGGALHVHRLGPRGLAETLPDIAAIALDKAPIAFGLALVENAYKQLVAIEGVEPEDFFDADRRLLGRARSLVARLPCSHVDALVVEWIGKEISGPGMDPVVTGRHDFRDLPAPSAPVTVKIGVLGITPASHGNAIGLGTADYTSRRVVEGVDLYATYLNAATGAMTDVVKMPMVLPDDRAVINACVATCWRPTPAEARLAIIHSTLHLDEILISPTLFEDMREHEGVLAISEPEPIAFSKDGRLLSRIANP